MMTHPPAEQIPSRADDAAAPSRIIRISTSEQRVVESRRASAALAAAVKQADEQTKKALCDLKESTNGTIDSALDLARTSRARRRGASGDQFKAVQPFGVTPEEECPSELTAKYEAYKG